MSWKNRLIKGLLWLLSPDNTRPKKKGRPDRYLIVSTTGLGDTLWGTPAIRALRQTYPDSYIAVLTSRIGYETLKHSKHIDEIFTLTSSKLFAFLRYLPILRKKEFDAVLVFHTSQRAALPICALIEAPTIVGTYGINKGLDCILTRALEKKRQHEIERRLDIVRAVGAHVHDETLEVALTKEETTGAKRFLDGHGIPDHIPLVGIHPGAKNLFKQWPEDLFIEVGRNLTQHMGCQIFVSGDRSEAPLVFSIASQIPGAIPIAGELDIPTFTALMTRFRLFITNDTGPMHLAFSAKTPTVALFGPTDPALCGPYKAKRVRVLSCEKTCTPCLGKNCLDPFCLRQIGPDAVYQAAIDLAYAGEIAAGPFASI